MIICNSISSGLFENRVKALKFQRHGRSGGRRGKGGKGRRRSLRVFQSPRTVTLVFDYKSVISSPFLSNVPIGARYTIVYVVPDVASRLLAPFSRGEFFNFFPIGLSEGMYIVFWCFFPPPPPPLFSRRIPRRSVNIGVGYVWAKRGNETIRRQGTRWKLIRWYDRSGIMVCKLQEKSSTANF